MIEQQIASQIQWFPGFILGFFTGLSLGLTLGFSWSLWRLR